jgi:hypothetical protein
MPHSDMIRLAAMFAFACTLLAPLEAQERHAAVLLDDGRRLEGRVLEMDLEQLAIEVDGKVVRVPASSIRSCRFRDGDDPASRAVLEDEKANAAASKPAAGKPEAGSAADVKAPATAAADPAAAPEAGTAAPEAAPEAPPGPAEPKISWSGPLQDPIDPGSPQNVPVDMRHRFHLKRRIEALDRAYPWLAPAAPSQWISLGLLLLVGSGLIVHMSVHICGGERPRLGRSVGLGIWYLLTAFAQVAMVPVNDLSVSVMVLFNGSVSLFWLCLLFGLTRGQAIVAQVVQLGFGALVFAILELVTSLLGSMGMTA